MKITLELLQNWGACSGGKDYFAEKFPNGADYAAVLTQCDLDDKEDYHQWLFYNAFSHLDAKELGEIAQSEAAHISGYVQKGLEPLALLEQELKDTDTVSKDHEARLAASGVRSRLAASGVRSRLAASGDDSRLAASGDYSQLAASGDYSRLAASGENSVIASSGLDSTFSLGQGGCAAIPYRDENKKVRFAVAYVGENIEADTWYEVNTAGEFVEVEA